MPRGAGTGLAGGAVPVEPGLLVVLTRLNLIGEVDEIGRTVWVGPGVINLDLSKQIEPLGLHFALTPPPSKPALLAETSLRTQAAHTASRMAQPLLTCSPSRW